ncbi:ankyrin repeat domain-containing protein [Winogradskyella maritima]|uniref:Ankyrin repeat domain-containing protein n=1 Tax=Winogradskyella maritima TaxID=1517766 RepID=A0ABV8AI62_9FLAO|nr:ankyrin repeat domain-containing protein [Winogradskyella maritima]
MNSPRPIYLFLFFISTLTSNAQQNVFDIARHGSVDTMKSAYAKDGDCINLENADGYTPLILASYANNIEVVRFLANKVYDVDANSNYGTALMAATYKGFSDIAEILLKNDANPNLQDEKGTTAAHFAVMFRRYEMIALLKEYKADFNIKNKQKVSPADYAKMHNDETINKLLNL